MLRIATITALGLSLTACVTTAPAKQAVSVIGSIAYRERIALPPTAQIEVRLDDVSLADAPSRTLARQAFTANGKQVPFAFALTVDKAALDPRHSYAVAARITDADGKLMFITDTRNSVAFDGRPAIEMGTLNLVMVR
jgi:putative lipoprotein